MFQIVGFVILLNFVELGIPKLLQLLIDSLLDKPLSFLFWKLPPLDEFRLFLLPILLVILGGVRWGAAYFSIALQARLGQESLQDMRSKIYAAIQKQSFKFHDKTHSGNLVSNVIEDLRYLNQFLASGFFPIFESVTFMVFVLGFLLYLSWPVGLATIVCFVGILGASLLLLRSRFFILLESKALFSKMVESFTENIEGYLLTSAFGMNHMQAEQHFETIHTLHQKLRQESLLLISFHNMGVLAANVSVGVSIGMAIYLIQWHNWEISGGTLFMIGFLQFILVQKVRVFGRAVMGMSHCLVTAIRLQNLFESKEVLWDAPGDLKVETTDFECQHLNFEYKAMPCLLDLSFKVKARQTVAIVGVTGSGKSTLIHLLARLYDADSGTLLLGGRPIQDYPLKELRKNVAVVFQNPFLFSGSIHENIAFGRPDANREEVEALAKLVDAHEFIMATPDGYDTLIGERGVLLSGGQRQRLSIARALIHQPKVLLLDDATSAMDAQTEQNILNNLAQHLENTTTFVVTHRKGTVRRADLVFLMEGGRICKQGIPDDFFQDEQTLHDILLNSIPIL